MCHFAGSVGILTCCAVELLVVIYTYVTYVWPFLCYRTYKGIRKFNMTDNLEPGGLPASSDRVNDRSDTSEIVDDNGNGIEPS